MGDPDSPACSAAVVPDASAAPGVTDSANPSFDALRQLRKNAAGNFSARQSVNYCEKPRVCHQVSTEQAGGASDAALVTATLGGDRDAFGQLVVRYQDRLFNALVRIGAGREDAADVVQEAFVQAYTKLGSFQGASQFYTWLYRVAMNLSISRRRRKRPTASLDAAREAAGDEPADRGTGPEGAAVSHERVALVRNALAHLGEEQRRILVLREIDGASYEEIAEILELPIGTVRSRLFRARMQLREKLEGVEDSGVRSQESQLPAHG